MTMGSLNTHVTELSSSEEQQALLLLVPEPQACPHSGIMNSYK